MCLCLCVCGCVAFVVCAAMAARGTVSNRKRVAKQGWLKKKGTGKKGVGRTNWTKRWLVLTDGAIEW